jgi:hypothetical protein
MLDSFIHPDGTLARRESHVIQSPSQGNRTQRSFPISVASIGTIQSRTPSWLVVADRVHVWCIKYLLPGVYSGGFSR